MRAPRIAGLLLTVSVLVVVTAGGVSASSTPPQPTGNVNPVVTAPGPKVAVVATAAPVDDRVAVLIQNGSTRAARVLLVSATATSRDGRVVTRARTLEAFPQVLAPNQLALAAVQFRKGGTSPGDTVKVTVRSTPVTASRAARVLAVSSPVLSPPQTGAVAQTLGATVTNPTTTWKARAPKVAVMCFGESMQPASVATARLRAGTLGPGKTVTVSVPLTSLCPSYLVAARAS
jgi:hypothetical protein